jgi:hypothetical protein
MTLEQLKGRLSRVDRSSGGLQVQLVNVSSYLPAHK